ncbi:MAG: DUF3572 domain-containing protein [Parvularculales bacterium]
MAETIALQALGAMVDNSDTLSAFLTISGLNPSSLYDHISDPSFLGGVMDFLATHENHLMAVCSTADMDPEQIIQARRYLPGASLDAL